MEDILELILSILFLPFEAKFEKLEAKIDRFPKKGLRILIKLLLFIVPIALTFGLCVWVNYLIHG